MSAMISVSEEPTVSLEDQIFDILNRRYVQQSDARQKRMGLQYMTAETHELAGRIARILNERRSEAENRVGTLEIQSARLTQERDELQGELDSCRLDLSAADEDAWKYRELADS